MGFLEKLLGGGHNQGHGSKHGRSRGNSHGGHHGEAQYHQEVPRALDSGWGTSGTASPLGVATLLPCINCSAPNDAAARFCQQCGQSLLITKCVGCNSTLKPEAKFCDQCGGAR